MQRTAWQPRELGVAWVECPPRPPQSPQQLASKLRRTVEEHRALHGLLSTILGLLSTQDLEDHLAVEVEVAAHHLQEGQLHP